MHPAHLIAYFFGGAFLSNVIPHLTAGVMGEPFQSPFAKPPGEGLSSSTVNVVWAFVNLAVVYVLLVRVGAFDLHNLLHVGAATAGAFLLSLMHARHFGRFHGGLHPTEQK